MGRPNFRNWAGAEGGTPSRTGGTRPSSPCSWPRACGCRNWPRSATAATIRTAVTWTWRPARSRSAAKAGGAGPRRPARRPRGTGRSLQEFGDSVRCDVELADVHVVAVNARVGGFLFVCQQGDFAGRGEADHWDFDEVNERVDCVAAQFGADGLKRAHSGGWGSEFPIHGLGALDLDEYPGPVLPRDEVGERAVANQVVEVRDGESLGLEIPGGGRLARCPVALRCSVRLVICGFSRLVMPIGANRCRRAREAGVVARRRNTDALGSVRGIISSTGTLTASTSYDAWGNPQASGGLTAWTRSGTPAPAPTPTACSTSSTATTTPLTASSCPSTPTSPPPADPTATPAATPSTTDATARPRHLAARPVGRAQRQPRPARPRPRPLRRRDRDLPRRRLARRTQPQRTQRQPPRGVTHQPAALTQKWLIRWQASGRDYQTGVEATREHRVTVLRFPAEIAVGEVWWEDAAKQDGPGHLLAIGAVEVPDGTTVSLSVYTVAEVSVCDQALGFFEVPAGTRKKLAVPFLRGRPRNRITWRVTWHREMPDRQLRNNRSIWGNGSHSTDSAQEPVDLEFIRGLPRDSVDDLTVGNAEPASFAAVAHLAPGLRRLCVCLDNLGDDAPSVIADLPAVETLALYGRGNEDGPSRLNDHALSVIADLPALGYLSLMDGTYTEHGLQQLSRLRKLRHLHIEREGLTAPVFQFAAAMPALTRLSGLDEFGDDGPMPPAEVEQVRAMLPHISVGLPARRRRHPVRPARPAPQQKPRLPRYAPHWLNSGDAPARDPTQE
jgi:hypothetical protein